MTVSGPFARRMPAKLLGGYGGVSTAMLGANAP